MASKPAVLIITGYGLNCEAESAHAWKLAGGEPRLIHLNDVLAKPACLHDHSALMFIGGFSFGDHMGSGLVFANRVRERMRDELQKFVNAGRLVLGVCNGFQIMTKLGLLPGLEGNYFEQRVALMQNDSGHFQNSWVTLRFEPASPCVFTRGLDRMPLPIRHGEGKLVAKNRELLARIEAAHGVPCRYEGENPNGSANAIAGLCDPAGRVFGLMPHPEAYLFPENHPQWEFQKLRGELPPRGLGLKIFENAVDFLKS